MTRYLADLPGSRVRETLTERSILVQPIGAIEHHGPHLPLRTDALVAEAVATAGVERALERGLDVWQLPTLSVGKSDEHHWAPGTLWLTADTLLAVLRDLGRSVAATGAKKLVFVNGHGGNTAMLQVANRELRRLFGLQPFTMPAGLQQAGRGVDGEPDERGFGIHAGWAETSIVLHLAPQLVDTDAIARAVPDQLADFELLGFNGRPVTFGWLSNDFGASGVIGDPTGASAEAGARLVADGIEFVAAALAEIDRYPPAADMSTELAGAALEALTAWLPPNDAPERPQMQLCTVDEAGRPDARTVLLSSWTAEGLTFHTDTASRKVAHLRTRPDVALVVLWPGFTRQLTVQGRAEVLDEPALAAAYAARSPYLQRLAWLNTHKLAQEEQAVRAARWAAFGEERDDAQLTASPTWTGYLVRPHRLTFWQSDPSGPSHRTEHRRGDDGWTVHHLAG